MRAEWQAHIDSMLEQYREVRDNLGRMQREMAELTGTAESPDGLVKATVDFRGSLTKLEFNPRLVRTIDSVSLAEVIVQTVQQASAGVSEQVRDVVGPNVPESAGLSGMGTDFDFSKMFPADPQDIPGARETRP
jgi:DNA-binding protein YbaB